MSAAICCPSLRPGPATPRCTSTNGRPSPMGELFNKRLALVTLGRHLGLFLERPGQAAPALPAPAVTQPANGAEAKPRRWHGDPEGMTAGEQEDLIVEMLATAARQGVDVGELIA